MPLPAATLEEIDSYVTAWKKANEKELAKLEERRNKAKQIAKETALRLGTAGLEIKKIWGFGSVFETWRTFRKDSDIDLAMDGGDWSKAWSILPKTDFEISLVDLEDQPPSFRDQVEKVGVLLYENP